MMSYSDAVLDHFRHPRNVGAAVPAPGRFRVGRAGGEADGATIEFQLEVDDGCIHRAFFRAWGCPHTIAIASWLTDQLGGRAVSAGAGLDLEAIAAALGLPAEKWRCVLTAEDALRAALAPGEERR